MDTASNQANFRDAQVYRLRLGQGDAPLDGNAFRRFFDAFRRHGCAGDSHSTMPFSRYAAPESSFDVVLLASEVSRFHDALAAARRTTNYRIDVVGRRPAARGASPAFV